MKKIITVLLSAAMITPLAACSAQQSGNNSEAPETTAAQTETKKEQTENDRETIYQVALLQSLTQGYYDGIIKVSELKKHGDIGIGTFEGVNGEMIVLDGKVYQALGDGKVQEADDNETVPFSNVTFFDKDGSLELSGGLSILNYPGTTAIHPIESEDMLVKTDEGLVADGFSHEHYLLVQEGDVRLLVTGCSHKGIANIMNWTKAFNITHVVGGFHLMGLKPGNRARFDALAEELLAYDVMYYTGHCTGIEQYAQLKCRMGDKVAYLGTGQVLELG